jgi:integrase
LQQLTVNTITKNALQSVFNELSAKLSPKTVKSIYGFFSAVIKEATGNVYKINLPKQYKRIYNTPDEELSKKILALVKNTDLEIPVVLALRCGLRISEVCGLKWKNVTADYIVIDNVIVSYGAGKFEKKPKTFAGNRKVPITPDIFELLSSAPRNTEYVINKNAKAIGAQFRRFLKSNDLPPMRFHDLRHGFASAMAVMGIPEAYAMAIGGWETPNVLHSIYEQTFEKQKEEFNLKIQNYFT